MTTTLLLSLCIAALPLALQAPEEKIPVFVRSTDSATGFSDPSKDRQDSIKDLQKNIEKSKVVRLASSEGDALVFIDVLSRETKRETNGWTAMNGQKQNKSSLTVRLT